LIRSFHHSDFSLELLRERKRESVTVVLPAREVAGTIGPIIECLQGLGELVDQVLVVDAASDDGSADLAASLGAEVVQEAELLPEFGPVLGKGDAMWRALSAARGDLIVYLDSDTRRFPSHFALGLLGPLLCHAELSFVKAAFRRPFTTPDGVEHPEGGGRVNELTARPLLRAFYPELAEFAQPLAGEVAARRELLHRLPFATGYSVEMSMLLDVHAELGTTDGMAQSDLDVRLNDHQALSALGAMASAVAAAVFRRLQQDGRLDRAEAAGQGLVDRPPFATLRAHA
jgi:glucosyl-3-phosphoglycerate synthase